MAEFSVWIKWTLISSRSGHQFRRLKVIGNFFCQTPRRFPRAPERHRNRFCRRGSALPGARILSGLAPRPGA